MSLLGYQAPALGGSTTSTTRTAPHGGVYRSPADQHSPDLFTTITNGRGDVSRTARRQRQRLRRLPLRRLGPAPGSGLRHQTLDESDQLDPGRPDRKPQVLRYASYVYDPESGLYYCSARYCDPATRQWTTADSAKADGEESAYQYCTGDPIGRSDPSGCAPRSWHRYHPVVTLHWPSFHFHRPDIHFDPPHIHWPHWPLLPFIRRFDPFPDPVPVEGAHHFYFHWHRW